MIGHILLIGQGPNDVGFLEGLRDRLGCTARITDYRSEPRLRKRGTHTRPKDARLIVQHFLSREQVDLVIRLTDGDMHKPQEVARKERRRFPDAIDSILICGVCDRDIEAWLSLDRRYAAEALGYQPTDLPEESEARSAFLKSRIRKALPSGQTYTAFIADFVRQAPREVMKRWLDNPAFSAFYDDCRAAAARHDCPVANLRE